MSTFNSSPVASNSTAQENHYSSDLLSHPIQDATGFIDLIDSHQKDNHEFILDESTQISNHPGLLSPKIGTPDLVESGPRSCCMELNALAEQLQERIQNSLDKHQELCALFEDVWQEFSRFKKTTAKEAKKSEPVSPVKISPEKASLEKRLQASRDAIQQLEQKLQQEIAAKQDFMREVVFEREKGREIEKQLKNVRDILQQKHSLEGEHKSMKIKFEAESRLMKTELQEERNSSTAMKEETRNLKIEKENLIKQMNEME
eukprot:Sdes_comp21668_c0_seq1m20245